VPRMRRMPEVSGYWGSGLKPSKFPESIRFNGLR
jgi:hypothetical protein